MTATNLQLRLASAAVGLPLVVGLTWLGGWPFALVAGAIAVLAAAEFVHGFLLPSQPFAAVWNLGFGLLGVGLMVAGAFASPLFLLVGGAIGVALLLAGYSRSNVFGPRKPLRVLGGAFFYIGLLLGMMVLLRGEAHGRDWVFLGLLATFAEDTGAYVVGRLTGRHLMAPSISPKKTWEGAIGGYAAGAAAVWGLHVLFGLPGESVLVAALALLVPPVAMVGDLFESWLKRRMGIKDASGLIPGHGGFMDRLDSVLFVMPLVYAAAVLSER